MARVKKISEELGFEYSKNKGYGEYRGFGVSLIQVIQYSSNQAFKLLYIPYEETTDEIVNSIITYFNENKKRLHINMGEVANQLISIRLKEGMTGIKTEELKELLDELTNYLITKGVEPKRTCAYCAKEAPDTVTYINDIKLPAHQACLEEAKGELRDKQKSVQPTSLGAYFGAFLGGMIGTVPYLIAMMFGWYVGLLTVLAGYTSYKGYKILGGTPVKQAKYVVAIITLVCILLSNYLLLSMLALGLETTFQGLLSDPEWSGVVIETLAFSTLFGLFGVGYSYRKMKSEEDNTSIK